MKEALDNHINNDDGLILGYWGRFTALIKLGYISPSAYITGNDSGEFISTMVNVGLVQPISLV